MIANNDSNQQVSQFETTVPPSAAPETIGCLVVGKFKKKVGDKVWVKWGDRYEHVVISGFYGSLIAVFHPKLKRTRRFGRANVSPLAPRWLHWEGTVVHNGQAYECELRSRRWAQYMEITAGPPHLVGQTVRKDDVAVKFYIGVGEIDHDGKPWEPWLPYWSYTNARNEAEKYNLRKRLEVDNFLLAQTDSPKQ